MDSDELEYSDISQEDNSQDEEQDDGEQEESEQESEGDLNRDLYRALSKDFNFAGNFYHCSLEPNAPNPILTIKGVGLIGLPLSERDAKVIISQASQAPFGKGEKTIIDTSIRDTWEIEPSSVSFQNPKWKAFVKDVVTTKVWSALGVAPCKTKPQCELYKLLLYQTGSHFLPHQDTAKAQGMFATVVIVLPSAFEGGAVHLSHAGRSMVLDVSKDSILNTSVLAWYTDVVHEVKSITSGHRLALSYNLIHTSSDGPQPSLPTIPSGALESLRKALQRWKDEGFKHEDDPKFELPLHAFMLSHQYSQDDLGRGMLALKGKDAHLVSCISPVVEEMNFVACLANLQRTELGTGDDDGGYYDKRGRWGSGSGRATIPPMGDIEETTLELVNLVRISGVHEVLDMGLQKFQIGEVSVVPRNAFESMSPDGKDYEGYQGNGAGGMSQWYHRSALVLFMKEDENHIVRSVGGPTALLRILPLTDTPTPIARDTVSAALKKLSSSEDAIAVLRHALSWKDHGIWNEAIPYVKDLVDIDNDTGLPQAIHVFELDLIQPGLTKLIQRQATLHTRLDVTKTIAEHLPDGINTAWIQHLVKDALSSYSSALVADVPTLVKLAQESEGGFDTLASSVIPKTTNQANSYEFLIALTVSLNEKCKQLLSSDDNEAEVEELSNLTRQSLLAAAAQWAKKPPPPNTAHHNDTLSSTVLVKRIIQLIDLCFSIGDPCLCAQIANEIDGERQIDVLLAIKAQLGHSNPSWVKGIMKTVISIYSTPSMTHIPILTWIAEVLGPDYIRTMVTKRLSNESASGAIYKFLMGLAKSLSKQLMSDKGSTEKVKASIRSAITRCILCAIPHWEQGVYVETSTVVTRHTGRYTSRRMMQATSAVRPENPVHRLLEIVKFCFSIEDLTPCVTLFNHLLGMPVNDVARRFEVIYAPLVPKLGAALASRKINPRLAEPFKSFYKGIISLYLGRVLSTIAPTPLPTFPTGRVGCGCHNCKSLDAWLSTTEPSINFREAQAIRKHLEDQINRARISHLVTYSTTKRGSSHTLVVDKRPEIMPSMKWREAKTKAARLVHQIGGNEEELKGLMQERYDDVLKALEGEKSFVMHKSKVPARTNAAASSSNNRPAATSSSDVSVPQVAGVKRKRRNPPTNVIDVLDLT